MATPYAMELVEGSGMSPYRCPKDGEMLLDELNDDGSIGPSKLCGKCQPVLPVDVVRALYQPAAKVLRERRGW